MSIDGKVPPTFHLTGSGELVFFIVTEISPDNQKLAPAQRDSSKDVVLWKIAPDNLRPNETKITQLPDIVYGVLPKGFVQKTPAAGAPTILLEDKIYQAGGPAADAHGGFVWFTIRDGKSVQVKEPSRL